MNTLSKHRAMRILGAVLKFSGCRAAKVFQQHRGGPPLKSLPNLGLKNNGMGRIATRQGLKVQKGDPRAAMHVMTKSKYICQKLAKSRKDFFQKPVLGKFEYTQPSKYM
jgi:hypothetical protein